MYFPISFKQSIADIYEHIYELFALNKSALKDGSGRRGDESKCNIFKCGKCIFVQWRVTQQRPQKSTC